MATTPPVSDEEADEATAPKVALQRTEFGVDLGTANSVNGLRALWRGLLKSRSNAPLQALRPVIMIKEGTNGLGMQLHLVAGPLNDAGAAAKICAVMTENDRTCETTVFDGQRLSFKSDDVTPAPPAAAPAKPTSRGKRGGSSKRAAARARRSRSRRSRKRRRRFHRRSRRCSAARSRNNVFPDKALRLIPHLFLTPAPPSPACPRPRSRA